VIHFLESVCAIVGNKVDSTEKSATGTIVRRHFLIAPYAEDRPGDDFDGLLYSWPVLLSLSLLAAAVLGLHVHLIFLYVREASFFSYGESQSFGGPLILRSCTSRSTIFEQAEQY